MILRTPTTKYELMSGLNKKERNVATTLGALKQKGWVDVELKDRRGIWSITDEGLKELAKYYSDIPEESPVGNKTWPLFPEENDLNNFKALELEKFNLTEDEAAEFLTINNVTLFYKCLIALSVMNKDTTYYEELKAKSVTQL